MEKKTILCHGGRLQCLRALALALAVCMMFAAVSCRDSKPDDKDLTQRLVSDYMDAFTHHQIGKMNQYSLSKCSPYNDSDAVDDACKVLLAKTKWSVQSVSISGSSGIALVSVNAPRDFEAICRGALDDTLLQIEQDAERLPEEVLLLSIKQFAGRADTETTIVEISLTKLNNKWYIAKAQDVTDILSDIRTAVVSVYRIIEG